MVCWVFLLQLFGAAQIGHTKWPKNPCAHACVENKPISIPFLFIPPSEPSIDSCRELLDAGATLFILTRRTTTSVAFVLA